MNQPSEVIEQRNDAKAKRSGCCFWGTVGFFWFTQFVGWVPHYGSSEFYSEAYFFAFFIACFTTLFFSIFLFAWKFSMRWILLGSLLWMFGLWRGEGAGPVGHFKKKVLHPIPVGVGGITAKGYSLFGSEWAFEFQADRSAIDTIIAHHELKPPQREDLESLRESGRRSPGGKNFIPPWVTDPNGAEQMEFHLKKTPDSDKSRGRALWLAYRPASKKAWFFYSAGI